MLRHHPPHPPPRDFTRLYPIGGPSRPSGSPSRGPPGSIVTLIYPSKILPTPFCPFPSLVFTLPFFSRAYRTTDASGFLRPLLPGFAQICPKYLFLRFICSKYPFLGFICPKYPFVRCICSKYPFFGVYLPKIPLFRVYLPKLPLFEAHLLKIPLFMGFICPKYPFFGFICPKYPF